MTNPLATDTSVLQMIRLKGRTNVEALAGAFSLDPATVSERVEALRSQALVTDAGKLGFKLSEGGAETLHSLLTLERAHVDSELVARGYEAFCTHNAELKSVMNRWQMRDAETPNDHSDASYDKGVIDALGLLHAAARPDISHLTQHSDRLASLYPARLDRAWHRVESGDSAYIARPIIDSYHTVWFELHEELIGLAGLTRAAEAAAGRAH